MEVWQIYLICREEMNITINVNSYDLVELHKSDLFPRLYKHPH